MQEKEKESGGGEGILDIAFIYHCCLTNFRELRGLKQHKCIISHFPWSGIKAWVSWVLCLGLKAVGKGSAQGWVASEAWGPLRSSCVCWQNLIPCSCRNHGGKRRSVTASSSSEGSSD